MHDEFKVSDPIIKDPRMGISKKGFWGGLVSGIGGVVDMGIDNAQASQPYTNMNLSMLNPTQQNVLAAMYNQVGPQIGQPGQVYPGQRVAPASQLQQQGFNMASGAPQFSAPIARGAQNIMGQLSRPVEQQYQPVIDAAMNTFQQRIAPDIMNRFAATGSADSGMAQQTMARAGADLSTQLAGQLAGMKQQGMQTQVSALPQMYQWSQQPTQLGAQMASLGSAQRGIGQEYLDAQRQRFYESDPVRNPWLALGMQLLPSSGMYTENAVVQQPISQERAVNDFQKAFFNPFDLW